ncbi:hypothetical protein [Prochlorococcus sp. MIT 1303]|uniref:hypothetical protein n=1 Tax=Prochlorococcus sp. MIT 1303 TaxID=1723647 RepID=UPI0007BC6E7A|nr:hypothetical protein [Prochlorococcus sp. MIT 1303]KZR63388.1 hypothetical protein PMIT1303_01754 [Prochlorococcus sp. MIT 1303]
MGINRFQENGNLRLITGGFSSASIELAEGCKSCFVGLSSQAFLSLADVLNIALSSNALRLDVGQATENDRVNGEEGVALRKMLSSSTQRFSRLCQYRYWVD